MIVLLTLVFLLGGAATACSAEPDVMAATPRAVATPLGPDLIGQDERIYWVYESEVALAPEDTPFLSFGVGGFGGKSQCAEYSVSYTYAADGRIEIERVVTRGPSCSEENMALSREFTIKLQFVDSITRIGDRLYLEGDDVQLVFRLLSADETEDIIPEYWRTGTTLPTPTPVSYP